MIICFVVKHTLSLPLAKNIKSSHGKVKTFEYLYQNKYDLSTNKWDLLLTCNFVTPLNSLSISHITTRRAYLNFPQDSDFRLVFTPNSD